MIDEMRPAVAPNFVVPVPKPLAARAVREQRGGGERLRLHPEVLVVIADLAVGTEAVAQAAVLVVPGVRERRVEQLDGARHEPGQRPMPLEDQQQLGPFRLVPRLEAPRPKDVRAVFLVVMPIDGPVGMKVLPDEPVRQLRLTLGDVRRDALGAIEVDEMPRRLVGREKCLGRMHVRVLAAVGRDVPVGRRFIGVKARRRVPKPALHQFECFGDLQPGLFDAGHGGMGLREQHEREAVAVPGAVDGPLFPVAPLDFPVVPAMDWIPVRVAQECKPMARVLEIERIAEMPVRHRVVEDEAATADEVTRTAVVDRAVVLEIVKEAARRVVDRRRIERQRVGDMLEQERAIAEIVDGRHHRIRMDGAGRRFDASIGVGELRHDVVSDSMPAAPSACCALAPPAVLARTTSLTGRRTVSSPGTSSSSN